MRKEVSEKEEVENVITGDGSDGEDYIEVLDSSIEEVKEGIKEEEPEDDIWDNMVVIENKKKKRKPKNDDEVPKKKLK